MCHKKSFQEVAACVTRCELSHKYIVHVNTCASTCAQLLPEDKSCLGLNSHMIKKNMKKYDPDSGSKLNLTVLLLNKDVYFSGLWTTSDSEMQQWVSPHTHRTVGAR